MSFLSKALGANPADALKPELLGSIRVAVVGEPSVGKTALTEVSRGVAAGAMSDTPAWIATVGCCWYDMDTV
jgi:hypothetical protein